jgi:hypothetical protein
MGVSHAIQNQQQRGSLHPIEYLIEIIGEFSHVGNRHDTLVPRAAGQAV